jgi:ABC-type enterochelin transport system permease subunit
MRTRKKTKVRTWYGLNGTVIIGAGLMHKSGVGSLLIPHPAVVNWLLRLGLIENSATTLRINHEIGHLQSAPLYVLYTAMNYTAIVAANQVNLFNLILVFICTHAAWEIMSEILTIVIDPQFYHKCYQGVSLVPRAIFWLSTISLTLIGWIIVLL